MQNSEVGIRIENLSKSFGSDQIIKNLNFQVKGGEFMTLLGPSGCGKTTTLRLILGSILPNEGKIYLGSDDVTSTPCHKRNVGIVYQNYALFPHMTAYKNIAFGLEIRDIPDIEIKIRDIMAKMNILGLEDRYPNQLSGGEQQRVALARTLVVEPRVLLLDEPLSNVDAKLRYELRSEIKDLQKSMGITTLYVTHDQEEALIISDRIAIMEGGEIIEVGSPGDLYFNPEKEYTRDFLGIVEKRLKNLEDFRERAGYGEIRRPKR